MALIIITISILLNIFLKGNVFIILQIFYYSISVLFCLYITSLLLLGDEGSHYDSTIKAIYGKTFSKYYCAIRYPFGSEIYSCICYYFSIINFVYTIALCVKLGIWFPIIISIFYFLFYLFFLGPRFNPTLFLGSQAKRGDINAAMELDAINEIKRVIFNTNKGT